MPFGKERIHVASCCSSACFFIWLKWSIVHLHVFVKFIAKELSLGFPLPLECHVLTAMVVCFVTFLRVILRVVPASSALDFAPRIVEVRRSRIRFVRLEIHQRKECRVVLEEVTHLLLPSHSRLNISSHLLLLPRNRMLLAFLDGAKG